ncbi:uncharacterized protein ACRADG_003059 isoform 2-T2 [Cochliomyia hominivorax]
MCPDDSPYFSIEDQTCDFDRKVCGDRPYPDGNFFSEVEIENPETLTTPGVVSTQAPIVATTTTSTSTTSSSSTLSATSTTTSSSSPTSTSTTIQPPVLPSILPNSCPSVDNPNKAVFLSHPKSCSDYYLCYQGERLPMHCSNMLHFDVRQQKCDYPERVKCQVMDIASPREQCLPHTYDVYPHPNNCNYYYQCTLGYLKVMQCPLNMGWHYEKRACVLKPYAKCYSSSKRSLKNK